MAEKNMTTQGIIVLALVLIIAGLASIYFVGQRIEEPIVSGP